ncbi:LETM1-like protein-domain-containing protein [Dissophora ornata]|nr:LETM1-like protein-domain-containing protein [Dissophora ornata]
MARAKAAKDTKDTSGIVSEGTVLQSKRLLWERVKKELVRYWDGTKLLGKEIKISTKLANRLLHGNKLNRGEQQQLRRTTRDLLRLIPFSVFVIVPFMEFLLPVALKLFPNMLPSTFEDAFAEEEKKRKLVQMRLEMAKFLQETIEESGIPGTECAEAMKTFGDFFRNVRATGEQASTEELIRIARLFQDEMTLDSLSRPQLVSMCRYMNLNAIGTDRILRYQLQTRMNSIKKDDMLIMAEGVESLTNTELRAACQYRGIWTGGVLTARLRSDLAQWIDLHLVHSIPSSLLTLSLVFSFSDTSTTSPPTETLQAALSSLPDTLLYETELPVLGLEGTATPKQKLEVEGLNTDEKVQEEGQKSRKDLKEMAKQRNRFAVQVDQRCILLASRLSSAVGYYCQLIDIDRGLYAKSKAWA